MKLKSLSALTTIVIASSGLTPTTEEPVTFYEDIQPIVFENCTSCHRAGEIGPFPLTTYAEVSKKAKTIRIATETRYMPPWHADTNYREFVGVRRLTDKQITLFSDWIDQGKPEGNPDNAVPTPQYPQGWRLGEPDLIVTMSRAFEIPADGPDLYRKFVLPLNFPQDRWVKAVELHSTAPTALHHSRYALDPTRQAVQLDGADGQIGFEGMAINQDIPLGDYVPGITPHKLPGDLARLIPKKTDLVLSSHFHPTGKVEHEQTSVGLYFADKPPSRNIHVIDLPPNLGRFAGIDIPAGKSDFKVVEKFTIPVDSEGISVHGHAHFLGKTMKMTALFPDGTEEVVLNIPEWDLDWQDTYYFKDQFLLPAGTVLTSTLIYDNSANNPNNPTSPPIRVKFGRSANDEMGSIVLLVVPTEPSQKNGTTKIEQRLYAQALAKFAKNLSRSQSLNELSQLMDRLDKNSDGALNQGELPARLRDFLLSSFDKDADKKLNSEESKALFERLVELSKEDSKAN
ncbi:MAG: hypothetical protein ACI8TQ_002883 [Planctomycetota bacterium]|jgi:hypothetical protein